MSMNFYVDETKAKGYLVAAASCVHDQLRISRKELTNLVLPGQRSLHMKDEQDSRKRQIADTIARMSDLGVRAVIYDAGRVGTEKERRARCMEALVEDAARHERARIVFDLDESLLSWARQTMIELTRAAQVKERVTYTHLTRHQEILLSVPDTIAWCWAKGGDFRQRVRPIVTEIRQV